MNRPGRRILFLSLLAVVVVIGLLHFFTPGHQVFFHNTYRRLSYFPIVLGGIWFGVRGGFIMALLSSIAFIPHILLFVGQGTQAYLGEMTEIVLYLAAGLGVGAIAGRETRLRKEYQELAEKLKKSYARLHEETEQLIEAEKQLAQAQKLSALGKLSASLVHEIKNPLSSIRGTAEILIDDFPEKHPKREFAQILLKETSRLNNTVEDVLRFSRQKQSEKNKDLEPLAGVIGHVLSLLERQLRDKNILCAFKGEKYGTVLVEGGKISQVLLNLIMNGLDAVSAGGKIEVEISETDQGSLVSVCDNGCGVKAQDRDRVFEPFYSGKDDGTGLGLLISRNIIESYGGHIKVMDNPGGGACFQFIIPFDGAMNFEESVDKQDKNGGS